MDLILAQQLALPLVGPDGYEPLPSEPEFDAAKHFQIERPDKIFSLAELGYSKDEIAQCPSDFGVTSVFRLLSDAGADALLEVAGQLETFTTSNPRISRNVRGAVFRSKFLRELCVSPEVTTAMSEIAGLPLL